MNYYIKYLKYKNKYTLLKNMKGGENNNFYCLRENEFYITNYQKKREGSFTLFTITFGNLCSRPDLLINLNMVDTRYDDMRPHVIAFINICNLEPPLPIIEQLARMEEEKKNLRKFELPKLSLPTDLSAHKKEFINFEDDMIIYIYVNKSFIPLIKYLTEFNEGGSFKKLIEDTFQFEFKPLGS